MIDFEKLAADLANATRGPWRVEENTTLVWGECDPDDLSTYGMGYPLASAFQTDRTWRKNRISEKNADANASLIAAAPDLARFALLVTELREALEFYGDQEAWNQPPVKVLDSMFGPAYENSASKIRNDRGKIARAALAKLDALLEGK